MGTGYQAQPLNYQRAYPGLERPYGAIPQGYALNPREQVIGVLEELYGIGLRWAACPAYRKPYPEQVNRDYEFPSRYKIPDFATFLGEDSKTVMEHISRFTTQCGEFSNL